jgi:hypothetical protein
MRIGTAIRRAAAPVTTGPDAETLAVLPRERGVPARAALARGGAVRCGAIASAAAPTTSTIAPAANIDVRDRPWIREVTANGR